MTACRYRIPIWMHAFTVILDKGEQTATEVAEQAMLHKSSAHRALVCCEQMGLLERREETMEQGGIRYIWSLGKRVRLGVMRDGR